MLNLFKKILYIPFVLMLVFLLYFTSIPSAAGYRMGVAPPFLNLGEVEKGSSNLANFDLVSSSTDEFMVKLKVLKGNMDFLTGKYKDLVYNYSEEDVSSWIEFINNPVMLEPPNETSKSSGWKKINFILNVPEDAEPGYHLVEIKPTPYVPAGYKSGSFAVATITVTVVFKVPGKAIRKGIILDVTEGKYVRDKLEVNTYFQNSGTVTISAIASPIKIYDKDGNIVKTLMSHIDKVKPGEKKLLKAYLRTNNLESGEYDVNTSVTYKTGSISKKSSIIFEKKLLPTPQVVKIPKEIHFPWWILITIIIIIIAYIIYKKGE